MSSLTKLHSNVSLLFSGSQSLLQEFSSLIFPVSKLPELVGYIAYERFALSKCDQSLGILPSAEKFAVRINTNY
jgi:hypothetical protein